MIYIVYHTVGGSVDLQTLVTLISRKVTNPPNERPQDLQEMFRMYDTGGKGQISQANMVHLLTTVGEKLTDQEADDLLKISGCARNGMVDYQRMFSRPFNSNSIILITRH